MSRIWPIFPGAYCVPSAIQALTGADLVSVIHPSINRHSGDKKRDLLDHVTGEKISVAAAVLNELGYNVRAYKSKPNAPLRAHVATWAKRTSERWPGRAVLVATRSHVLVVSDGTVYDNHMPLGAAAAAHPYAKTTVIWAALVEKRA